MICKAQEVYDTPVTNWKSEYKRCLLDETRSYMIEKFIFGKELLYSQRAILNHIKKNSTNVISKSRDIGYTSIMAAYVACEIALNCDEKSFNMLYVGHNSCSCHTFSKMVLEYLEKIPRELYSDEDAKVLFANCKEIVIGGSRLGLTNCERGAQRIIESIHSWCVSCIIFDEIAFIENIDISNIIDMLHPICTTMILGSNPNHENLNWYNFVKKYKDSSNYIEVPWHMNQLHKDSDNDLLEIITDADGKEEYRTNKWYRKRRHLYFNEDEFKEEYEAKVWKYKTIKEYV
jgi:hypothetical protein